jgi:hypothetical protein
MLAQMSLVIQVEGLVPRGEKEDLKCDDTGQEHVSRGGSSCQTM